jgi:hypothetical protein
MALPGSTLYQKRTATRRRTADVTRLADQYQRNVEAMTGEYEQAFAQYQAQTQERMAPYEAQVGKYTESMKTYEQQAAAYKTRLDAYVAGIEDVRANPLQEVGSDKYSVSKIIRYGTFVNMDGQSYSIGDGIANYNLPVDYEFKDNKLYRQRPDPGAFTDAVPVAPTVPVAPEVPEFDPGQFDARRVQLETEFKRELGERRSARRRAVSRGGARPLLQGT